MRRIFLLVLLCLCFIARIAVAKESEDELKAYLSNINTVVIEIDHVVRNLSMNFLTPEAAAGEIAKVIEKFESLKPPEMFEKDHANMLLAFKTLKDGLELLMTDREKSIELVREGAALLKEVTMNIRTVAEEEGLVPPRPKTPESTKPILPSQTPTMIAGTSPTPSPHIASPGIERFYNY